MLGFHASHMFKPRQKKKKDEKYKFGSKEFRHRPLISEETLLYSNECETGNTRPIG
jgi:hypothetical protein